MRAQLCVLWWAGHLLQQAREPPQRLISLVERVRWTIEQEINPQLALHKGHVSLQEVTARAPDFAPVLQKVRDLAPGADGMTFTVAAGGTVAVRVGPQRARILAP